LPVSASPWLHEEVARRMEERLGWINLKPIAWAHWAPVRGGLKAHALIAQRYPNSQSYVVEVPASHQQFAINSIVKPWWNPTRWTGTATWFEAPPDAGVQMVWANMALHMAADPQALISAWHQALAVNGFVMFSCLGPDTLRELRQIYAEQGWPAPSHEFTDMHDWGDMLVAAGFAEPVMDMERITLSFSSPERLLQELRTLGRNLHPARFEGLRGRGWLAQLNQQIRERMKGQPSPKEGDSSAEAANTPQLTLTFEVIYGHALKPLPRVKMQAESSMSLTDMRLALQRGKVSKGSGSSP
jgi:malonyl-CoA O-methyltransferase